MHGVTIALGIIKFKLIQIMGRIITCCSHSVPCVPKQQNETVTIINVVAALTHGQTLNVLRSFTINSEMTCIFKISVR